MKSNAILALGIDPGNVQSATAVFNTGSAEACRLTKIPNGDMFAWLEECVKECTAANVDFVVGIEQIRSYGMAIGATVLDTVHWSGRFHEHLLATLGVSRVELIPRRDVKMHLCQNNRAKDTNVNHAIADRYGGVKKCKGTRKNPGPLYGIANDMWAALGVAITLGENTVASGVYEYGSAWSR